jgi:hypothetical protein
MKVGDKVCTFANEGLIVYIDNNPGTRFPYLVVYINTNGGAYSNWHTGNDLKPVPKFKTGEVWLTRNGKKLTIVSVHGNTILAVRDPNTEHAAIFDFEPDGKYHADCENDYDLMEKVNV